MDIFLVRHGEASASWSESSDPGLSALGNQQAESAAVILQKHMHQQTVLWSSPLRRAIETANPLAKMIRQDVCLVGAYSEIPAPVALSDRQAWLRQFMQQSWQEQGEELLAWRRTALLHLLAVQSPAVVFTHFLVINAVIGQLLHRDQTLCFWPANGSITHLRHTGAGLELIALGEEMSTQVN